MPLARGLLAVQCTETIRASGGCGGAQIHRACSSLHQGAGSRRRPAPVHAVWAPAHRTNPRPLYARLRQQAPLLRVEDQGQGFSLLVTTRYAGRGGADARDPPMAKSGIWLTEKARQRFFSLQEGALLQHMLNMEPADQTRLCTLVSQAFTPRRVEALRPRIHALASELLPAALAQRRVDFMDTFTFPLPLTVTIEGCRSAARCLVLYSEVETPLAPC